jgi:riboflavin kinase/FMN adenylyltransferase
MEGFLAGEQTRVHDVAPPRLSASVVTIGAFDGVHRGHQSLIWKTIAAARARGVPSVIWTFDPPPKVFFKRADCLTPIHNKIDRISFFQPDHIVVSRFDDRFRKRSAMEFIRDFSVLNPLEIWIGNDFRFGAGQTGDAAMLSDFFKTSIHPPVVCSDGEIVSSTRIRNLRRDGFDDLAEKLQGWFGMMPRRDAELGGTTR